ncbi:MAG: hypothetical protein DHS20C01_12870 [marine bacterium B5-7]|nr:MAG: hypothetical protein DHS20C01_12870 [marine bacterium B5-7]
MVLAARQAPGYGDLIPDSNIPRVIHSAWRIDIQAATWRDTETPTPSDTMHKSIKMFMIGNSLKY